MTDVSGLSDAELLSLYAMPSLKTQESGNRPGVLGPQTRYGRAEGLTQMLPATAQQMAQKLGMSWQPELMRGTSPEAADYQEALGRAYLQEGIEKTGNLQDGLRYYHGGPDRKQWGPKTEAYAGQVVGRLSGAPAQQQSADLSGMSDAELMAMYQGGGAPAPQAAPAPLQPGPSTPVERNAVDPKAVAALGDTRKTSQGLGFMEEFARPFENLNKVNPLNALDTNQARDTRAAALGDMKGYFAGREQTERPGKTGGFIGGVLGTLPVMAATKSPILAGGLSGMLQTKADDLQGVLRDAAIGGAAGKAGDLAVGAGGKAISKLLEKAPKAMTLPELEQAVKGAYAKVDASGFKIPTPDMKALADAVQGTVRQKGGPKAAKLYGDADAFSARIGELAKEKGGVSVSMLDDLRSDLYDALIKPGGKEAGLGKNIRAQIDGLIDSVPNGDVKSARELYMRLSKLRTVTKTLDSADLRKSAAYSGANTDNTIRQQVRPLVDPTSGKRIANATPDEQAALRKVVEGTKGQNLARVIGQGTDPRKLLGKISGLGALGTSPFTAGMSLALPALGLATTTMSNRASQKNVAALAELIAAGGSKQALKKAPTAASALADRLSAAVRAGPEVGVLSALLAGQPAAAEDRRKRPGK